MSTYEEKVTDGDGSYKSNVSLYLRKALPIPALLKYLHTPS
jgi:hypothetical protein